MINFCILLVLCCISFVLTYILKYIRYLTFIVRNGSVTKEKEMSYQEFLQFMKKK